MKTNNNILANVKLSTVRKSFASLKGTPCAIIKQIFSTIDGENSDEAKFLRTLLPKRQQVIDTLPSICAFFHVGETVTNKAGKTRTIRFTADMVLRYYTKAANNEINAHNNGIKAAQKAAKDKARAEKKAAEEKAKAERKAERARAKAERDQKKVEKALQKSTISPNVTKAQTDTKPANKGTKSTKGAKGTKKNEVKPAA